MRIEDIKKGVDREIQIQQEKAATALEKAQAIRVAWDERDVEALIELGAICSLHRDWLTDYWWREKTQQATKGEAL